MMIRYVFVGLLVVTMGVQSAEPDWYRNPTSTQYHVDTYIVGVGHATRLSRALDIANAEIAGQIETEVSEETTFKTIETHQQSSRHHRHTIQSDFKSNIKKTLTGVQVVKQTNDNGQYYVMAVLNKAQYRHSLSVQLKALNTAMYHTDTHRRTLIQQGNYTGSLDSFHRLVTLAQEFELKETLYSYVSKRAFNADYPGLTLAEIQAALTEFLSGLTLTVTQGNGQTVLPGQPVAQAVRILMQFNDKPVPNFPIRILYSDTTPFDTYYSDRAGYIQFKPYGLPLLRRGQYLTALPQLQGDSRVWASKLAPAIKIDYDMAVPDEPVRLALQFDTEAAWTKRLNSRLSTFIKSLGYRVDQQADRAIVVSVDVDTEKEMRSFRKSRYLISGQIRFALAADYDGQALEIPFKIIAKSKRKAIKTLVRDMIIPKIAFYDMVNKIGGIQ